MVPMSLKTPKPFGSSSHDHRSPSRVSTAPADTVSRTSTNTLSNPPSGSNNVSNTTSTPNPTAGAGTGPPSSQQNTANTTNAEERSLPRIRLNTNILHPHISSSSHSHSRTNSTSSKHRSSDKQQQQHTALDRPSHNSKHGLRDAVMRVPQSAVQASAPGGGLLGDREREMAVLARTASTRSIGRKKGGGGDAGDEKEKEKGDGGWGGVVGSAGLGDAGEERRRRESEEMFVVVGGVRRRKGSITKMDVDRARKENLKMERDLRTSLTNLTNLSATTTRSLDYTYYSLLEKTGSLQSTINSFHDLASLATSLHSDFNTESSNLTTETERHLAEFDALRLIQEKKVAVLEKRMDASKNKTEDLKKRLEVVRGKIEDWDRGEAEWQARVSRRLQILWGIIGFLLLVFVALLMFQHFPEREAMATRGTGLPRYKVEPFAARVVGLGKKGKKTKKKKGDTSELKRVDDGDLIPTSKEEIIEMVLRDIGAVGGKQDEEETAPVHRETDNDATTSTEDSKSSSSSLTSPSSLSSTDDYCTSFFNPLAPSSSSDPFCTTSSTRRATPATTTDDDRESRTNNAESHPVLRMLDEICR